MNIKSSFILCLGFVALAIGCPLNDGNDDTSGADVGEASGPVSTAVPTGLDTTTSQGTTTDGMTTDIPGDETVTGGAEVEAEVEVGGNEEDASEDSGDNSSEDSGHGDIQSGPKTFYGITQTQNTFADSLDSSQPKRSSAPTVMDVLVLLVDTPSHSFTGTPADRTAYRNQLKAVYDAELDPFWQEASFGHVGVTVTMPDVLLHMAGQFWDYFNRDFVRASLESRGLAGTSFPLTLSDNTLIEFEVFDASARTTTFSLEPPNTVATLQDLVNLCQMTAKLEFDDWLDCTPSPSGELRLELRAPHTKEASYIRVKDGNHLDELGFQGPRESPGATGSTNARLRSLSAPGGYPATATGSQWVTIEVRDGKLRTRSYQVAIPPGTHSKSDIETILLNQLNGEFNWVTVWNAGEDRLGLEIVTAFDGPRAAIRVLDGHDHAAFGLAGPRRVDGVIHESGTATVRGDRPSIVAEALSRYVEFLAQQQGIVPSAMTAGQIQGLIDDQLTGFESFMVLFADAHLAQALPTGRRAGASSRGYYDLKIPGIDGHTIQRQLSAGLMIGAAYAKWETWAHEIGHNLSFPDLYEQPFHDAKFDDNFDFLNEWDMMNYHWNGSHPGVWVKSQFEHGWIDPSLVRTIQHPSQGQTKTVQATLIPIEYPAGLYANVGSDAAPKAQVLRLELSKYHHIYVGNRQPGPKYSQNLPGVAGIANATNTPFGGVLVSDGTAPRTMALFRSPVQLLNPAGPMGSNRGAGMQYSDFLDLATTLPAYDGISVEVVGTEPDDPNLPEAQVVEVVWGPGDFIDLEIRPWHAPTTYATPDIWIDWPGNGVELYANEEPPLGHGDDTHWHPDQKTSNLVRVRVHNRGTIDATGVEVGVWVNDPMGLGDRGKFVKLGTDGPKVVTAGGYTNFEVEWKPTKAGHTCLFAGIETHTSPFSDLDLTNNGAQENIDHFHGEAGQRRTGGSMVDFEFTVNNDFPEAIEVRLRPRHLTPGIDLELETSHLELDAKETRVVTGRVHHNIDRPHAINVEALLATADAWLPFGGITLNLHPRKPSFLSVTGARLTVDGAGQPTTAIEGKLSGQVSGPHAVDVVLSHDFGGIWTGSGLTKADGTFSVAIGNAPKGGAEIMVYYMGHAMNPSTLGPKMIDLP